MNPEAIVEVLGILALLAWMGYRQSTWRPVEPGRIWRLPVILAVVGVVLMANVLARITAVDVAVLVVELTVSVGVGVWMGAIAHFRRLPEPYRAPKSGTTVAYESRTSVWGLVLWAIVIAVRVAIEVAAAGAGAVVASSTGAILLMLAANRLARIAVLLPRLDRHALSVA